MGWISLIFLGNTVTVFCSLRGMWYALRVCTVLLSVRYEIILALMYFSSQIRDPIQADKRCQSADVIRAKTELVKTLKF